MKGPEMRDAFACAQMAARYERDRGYGEIRDGRHMPDTEIRRQNQQQTTHIGVSPLVSSQSEDNKVMKGA